MNHRSKSNHANVLMSGHNPEHHNHQHKSHRGTSNVQHHMKKHNSHVSHETHSAKPCDILMREHHYSGGITNAAPHYSHGGKAHRKRKYAEGGHIDHKADGGPMGMALPQHHFDWASVTKSMGGRRPLGGGIDYKNHGMPMQGFSKGGHCYSEGGDIKTPVCGKGRHYAEGGEAKEYGEKPLTGQLRKGGRARHRHHHAEGESVSEEYHGKGGKSRHYEGEPVGDNSVRQEQSKGGKTKRRGHYWGQNFIGRLPMIGGLANSIANTVGTLDPHKYGGSEYVAKTGGQKAADIFSTIGNLGANVALSKKSKGGGVHHHKHRQHHAAGGAGKVRKGMMTESGHMIHSDI